MEIPLDLLELGRPSSRWHLLIALGDSRMLIYSIKMENSFVYFGLTK